jgi:hypothetical protein
MCEMQCGSLFSLFHIEEELQYHDTRMNGVPDLSRIYKIFIPSPTDYVREESFSWHITTRNFFAFLLDKPLVGSHLGKAIVDLQDRLQLFRTGEADNIKDMATYMESVGYLEFNHCADYALAVLYYAEHFKYHEMWIDAFCHCIGMNDILHTSLEFEVGSPLEFETKVVANNISGHLTEHQIFNCT